MRILGMISGTSHDGIDCAIVDLSMPDDVLEGIVVHEHSEPYRPELRALIVDALPGSATTAEEICRIDTGVGLAFADAAVRAIRAAGGVELIVSHGQTLYHGVSDGRAWGTLQLGNPAWIAEETGVPVLSDIRMRDITAGGQGAPLVALLDSLLLGKEPDTSVALNLGGIANVTVLREGQIRTAYDTGPANALIDAYVVRHDLHPAGFDLGGDIAARGAVDEALLAELAADGYFALPTPKSTGKELFNLDYLEAALARRGAPLPHEDVVASLAEFTARTVAVEVQAHEAARVVASGGGTRNRDLLARLRAHLPGIPVVLSDEYGISSDFKEAIAFAVIGWHSFHGLPATRTTATGARRPSLLGSLTPGWVPLSIPVALKTAPRALRLRREDDAR